MQQSQIYGATSRTTDGAGPPRGMFEEESLGELFKRLSTDTSDLVRQEIALAKAEFSEVGATAGKSAASFAVSLVLAICGALALTAALIIALGNMTGGRYALWSLIVGAIAVGIAAMLAKGAAARMAKGLKPRETIQTVRETTAWTGRELQDLKSDITNDPQMTPSRG
ncbi:MAG TPA: phage holin family protein [Gemmatimonadaceae bacterium]|nr:phage holin family protein [Gemmatimonadaceae bacterium]